MPWEKQPTKRLCVEEFSLIKFDLVNNLTASCQCEYLFQALFGINNKII